MLELILAAVLLGLMTLEVARARLQAISVRAPVPRRRCPARR
ncbi:MAG: hypothetical protein QJR07_11180 [Acetobacteraceae bacterium]|nr:hypothetical protein [Acetobacteraceae bacterium]